MALRTGFLFIFCCACIVLLMPAFGGVTARVSVSSNGTAGNGYSYDASLSADGRYVAFTSVAANLVAGDTNGFEDVFIQDRTTRLTTRISVSGSGVQGDDGSYDPSISADGRYVAFTSAATTLITGDTNGCTDVFVRDLTTGQLSRASSSSSGGVGNGNSFDPTVSADGRYIAFTSAADNLIANDTNVHDDIFVYDRTTGQTTRVNVSSNGTPSLGDSYAPAISADGRYIAFTSYAANLVTGDTNGSRDVFVRDRTAGLTTRVSVSSSGVQGNDTSYNPAISADGHCVAFVSGASTLVADDTNSFADIFVHDSTTGQTTCASVSSSNVLGNSNCYAHSVSADGRYVAFQSSATNLVEEDTNAHTDIFLRDRVTAVTSRVSVNTGGVQGNNESFDPAISANGRYIAFQSDAFNLIANDANAVEDVFVHDCLGVEGNFQPDLLLRTGTETSYLGDNVYNTTGAGQSKSQSIAPGQTATYYCRVQNDGSTATSFIVTGPAGTSAYAVGYVNYATNAVITGAVTGVGWNTGVVPVGQYVVVVIRVVPSATALHGSSKEVKLLAQSTLDPLRMDLAKTTTSVYIPYQPDLQVRTSTESSYVGDDVYNLTGVGQTKTQSVEVNHTATYYCRVQNDGSLATSYNVTGTAGSTGYAVGYVDYATNAVITNAVTGTGWSTGVISPGQYVVVVIRVVPSSSATAGSWKDVWLQAQSSLDAQRIDAAKTQTSLIASFQPDVLIRSSTESSYTGDNLYNLTGSGQAKAQSMAVGLTATYYCRIQNDGYAADTFTVTGLAGGSDFAVGYVNYATNAIITSAVTGTGWSTGSVPAGQYVVVMIRVVPSAGTPVGSAKEIWLQAKSTQDASRIDLVKATTTRQ